MSSTTLIPGFPSKTTKSRILFLELGIFSSNGKQFRESHDTDWTQLGKGGFCKELDEKINLAVFAQISGFADFSRQWCFSWIRVTLNILYVAHAVDCSNCFIQNPRESYKRAGWKLVLWKTALFLTEIGRIVKDISSKWGFIGERGGFLLSHLFTGVGVWVREWGPHLGFSCFWETWLTL